VNWFVLILFVVLPALGTVLGIRNWLLFRQGVRVTGRIVAHERLDAMSDGETVYLPVVDFPDVHGRAVRVTMPGESPHAGDEANAVGAKVRLVYPCGRPKRARYDVRMLYWLVPSLCFVPALTIALFIGLSIAWYRLFG
jgi:hypothetical protein